MSKYSVHFDPAEMEDLNRLSPFNLDKDLKGMSEETIVSISEEIANELKNGINKPPTLVLRYLAKLKNAAWVKIKTVDVERDAGKSNGYRCIVLVDIINKHAYLLHLYRHAHGEDKDIDQKSQNKLKKLVEEYSNALKEYTM